MNKTTIVAVAAAAVIGAASGALVVAVGGGGTRTIAIVEPAAPSSAPVPAPALLPPRRAQRSAPRPVDVEGVPSTEDATDEVPAHADARPATADEVEAARFEGFARYLADEPRDAVWQRDMEDAVTRLLADGTVDGAYLQDIACGSSLCRVELAHADLASREAFAMQAPSLEPFAEQGVMKLVDDGDQARSVLYVARSGGALPEIEIPL